MAGSCARGFSDDGEPVRRALFKPESNEAREGLTKFGLIRLTGARASRSCVPNSERSQRLPSRTGQRSAVRRRPAVADGRAAFATPLARGASQRCSRNSSWSNSNFPSSDPLVLYQWSKLPSWPTEPSRAGSLPSHQPARAPPDANAVNSKVGYTPCSETPLSLYVGQNQEGTTQIPS